MVIVPEAELEKLKTSVHVGVVAENRLVENWTV